MKKVLVAVDGYTASMGAAKKAVELAVKYDAELIAIRVEEEFLRTEHEREEEFLAVRKYLGQISETPLELVAAYGKQQNIDVKTIKTSGVIASTILQLAETHNADFIVIGDSARKGLERIHFGSIAESIVKTSNVPVIVVRSGIVDISDIMLLAKQIEGTVPKEEVAAAPVFSEKRYQQNFSTSFSLLTIFTIVYFGAALLTTAEFKHVAAFKIAGVPFAVLLGMLVFIVGLGVTRSYLKKSV